MGDKSAIEWTDATWNPVTGCTKVSAGCDRCYAERFAERFRGVPGHPFEKGFDLQLRPDRLDRPLRWTRPRKVFVNSMSDLWHKHVPENYVDRVFDVMERAPRHTFQVLTKRSTRMRRYLRRRYGTSAAPAHIWCGVSIEDRAALSRLRHLREAPAAVRFLSLEPLLGSLGGFELEGVSWVIVGGESGPGARPMAVEWVREVRDLCRDAAVPFFFKQWGGSSPKSGGRILDGGCARGLSVRPLPFRLTAVPRGNRAVRALLAAGAVGTVGAWAGLLATWAAAGPAARAAAAGMTLLVWSPWLLAAALGIRAWLAGRARGPDRLAHACAVLAAAAVPGILLASLGVGSPPSSGPAMGCGPLDAVCAGLVGSHVAAGRREPDPRTRLPGAAAGRRRGRQCRTAAARPARGSPARRLRGLQHRGPLGDRPPCSDLRWPTPEMRGPNTPNIWWAFSRIATGSAASAPTCGGWGSFRIRSVRGHRTADRGPIGCAPANPVADCGHGPFPSPARCRHSRRAPSDRHRSLRGCRRDEPRLRAGGLRPGRRRGGRPDPCGGPQLQLPVLHHDPALRLRPDRERDPPPGGHRRRGRRCGLRRRPVPGLLHDRPAAPSTIRATAWSGSSCA